MVVTTTLSVSYGLKDVRFHDLRHTTVTLLWALTSALGGGTRPGPHASEYDISLRERECGNRKMGGSGAEHLQCESYARGTCRSVGALNGKQC
ncbi:MAG TPA: hypothetical protein VGO56_12725 [Pyrinomonadaceae bacterium]|jgi:hypothetical protein|nr:hypothetical protein [Pyrinomonadaceae bacterium]